MIRAIAQCLCRSHRNTVACMYTHWVKIFDRTDTRDVIIFVSGMAGLYAALKVRKLAPTLSFLVVEKYDTYGGRSYNEDFENTSVVKLSI